MDRHYLFGLITGIFGATVFRFIVMGVEEAFVKPLAIKFAQANIRKFVKPALDIIDEKIQLPENWEKFVDQKGDWIMTAVLPELKEVELSEPQLNLLKNKVIQEFDLSVFLEKVRKNV